MDSPSNNTRLSFATDIKPLFRQHDRQSIEKVFDLWSFDDVRAHASEILERVKNGSMPCDGAWAQREWKSLNVGSSRVWPLDSYRVARCWQSATLTGDWQMP